MIRAYNHNTYIAINYSTSQVSHTHVLVVWIYLTNAMHCALGNTVIGANMVLPQSQGNTVFRISSAVMIKWPISYCWYSNIPKCNWISKCLYGFNSIFKYHREQIFRTILLQKLALINSLKYWSYTYRRQKPYHHSSCRCSPNILFPMCRNIAYVSQYSVNWLSKHLIIGKLHCSAACLAVDKWEKGLLLESIILWLSIHKYDNFNILNMLSSS